MKAMPQQGDEHLRPWIDTHALSDKHQALAVAHAFSGCQLAQEGIVDDQVQAGIPAS